MNRFNKSGSRVGDTVVVKPGVMCPDKLSLSLAGWQGWVTEIYPQEGTLEIAWDSVTLQALPNDYICDSEREGLGWDSMVLGSDEVALTKPRESRQKAELAAEKIREHHVWDHLSDINPGISKLLGPLGKTGERAYLSAWEEHLDKALTFPFEARCEEQFQGGPLGVGTVVNVLEITDVDDLYGLLVRVSAKRNRYTVPLCDLQATDHFSSNYQPLNDYVVWFANR